MSLKHSGSDTAERDLKANAALEAFARESRFGESGAVVTDLDGTAVHELQGISTIPEQVEFGLKALRDRGRPIILNSLRFPLSIIRTFGQEWFRIAGESIPTVSLNGSLLGYVVARPSGEIAFQEIAAYPIPTEEKETVLAGAKALADEGFEELILFFYPRDWRAGESIWTPSPARVAHVAAKYTSASQVTAVQFESLRERLLSSDIAMMFLLVDIPEDRRMAYQHQTPAGFITRKGVDKREGAARMAAHLGVRLADSVGAGDTEMDNFLSEVGLAIHVGAANLPYEGRRATIRVRTSAELGRLLFRLAELHPRVEALGG
jgi:hydroxymethylpyrimidine pyrophosphatase-like HAD family hydrolase